MAKKIALLGSTGSIGRQVLQVVDEFPADYQITALAAGTNVELLARQIRQYRPELVSVANLQVARRLAELLQDKPPQIVTGTEGLLHIAKLGEIDLIVIAVTGIHGLLPTLSALERGKSVALANKETLVTAGSLVMAKAREKGLTILPVDSEHSAIFQCLEEENTRKVEKLLLTASGGPFLHISREEMEKVTPQKALQHPKWQMGPKITIDSAGLINKGLEVIEAHWLFGVPYEQIQVVIHPQSIIHSMVQYQDGAVLAQLGTPDMRTPIQYALTYPYRCANSFPKLDFTRLLELTFQEPDLKRFPGLALAYEAGKTAGTMPAVYNAANEMAVNLFLEGKIKFTAIPGLIERVMDLHRVVPSFTIDDIMETDRWARAALLKVAGNQ